MLFIAQGCILGGSLLPPQQGGDTLSVPHILRCLDSHWNSPPRLHRSLNTPCYCMMVVLCLETSVRCLRKVQVDSRWWCSWKRCTSCSHALATTFSISSKSGDTKRSVHISYPLTVQSVSW